MLSPITTFSPCLLRRHGRTTDNSVFRSESYRRSDSIASLVSSLLSAEFFSIHLAQDMSSAVCPILCDLQLALENGIVRQQGIDRPFLDEGGHALIGKTILRHERLFHIVKTCDSDQTHRLSSLCSTDNWQTLCRDEICAARHTQGQNAVRNSTLLQTGSTAASIKWAFSHSTCVIPSLRWKVVSETRDVE